MMYPYFILVAVLILLCALAAWSRRERWIRWIIVIIGISLVAGAYPAMIDLLSRPKDVTEEWFQREASEAKVMGVFIDEGTALYLYLMLPGLDEPRSYRFPWSEETRKLAQSLQDALDSKEGQENGVVIPFPFKPSLEREKPLTAHPMPQLAPPLKRQPRAPLQFGA